MRAGWQATRLVTIAGALLAAAGSARAQESGADWLAQCRRDSDRDAVRACEVRTSGFRPAGGAIAIEGGENGGVEVRGWEQDSVAVEARITARAPSAADAEALARQVQISSREGAIRADGPEPRRRASWWVSFVVMVPSGAEVRAEAENGPLAARGTTGRVRLRTVNGPVALAEVSGDVRARTENGPITVRLAGDRWTGEGLDAQTENGPISLTIPERYSAQLETGTENGPLSIDFPLTLQGRITKRISAQLGSGGATIRAVTTNGPVSIRMAK